MEVDPLLTTSEAADKLGVSIRAVQIAIKSGRLQAQKMGRDFMIRQSALKEIIRKPAGRPAKPKAAKKGESK